LPFAPSSDETAANGHRSAIKLRERVGSCFALAPVEKQKDTLVRCQFSRCRTTSTIVSVRFHAVCLIHGLHGSICRICVICGCKYFSKPLPQHLDQKLDHAPRGLK
jgi:hypothetical protein